MQQQSTPVAMRCVWMDAGVLTYKLCDREFACEECPLDMVLRKSDEPPLRERTVPRLRVRCTAPEGLDEGTAKLIEPMTHVDLPEDLLYSPQHVWVRTLASRAVLLGVDPALATVLPDTSRLVLASGRAALEKGKPFAWIYHGQRVLALRSPLTGTVLRQNPSAEHSIRTSTDGWVLAMMPSHLSEEVGDLQPARESAERHEKLLGRFATRATRYMHADAGVVMNDGGVAIGSLEDALGEERYFDLIRAVFFPR